MNKFTEKSTISSDEGSIVGVNPNTLTVDEWVENDFSLSTGLQVIREKCYDCSGDDWSEVKKCTVISCPLWPLRLGSVPKNFRKAKEERNNASI